MPRKRTSQPRANNPSAPENLNPNLAAWELALSNWRTFKDYLERMLERLGRLPHAGSDLPYRAKQDLHGLLSEVGEVLVEIQRQVNQFSPRSTSELRYGKSTILGAQHRHDLQRFVVCLSERLASVDELQDDALMGWRDDVPSLDLVPIATAASERGRKADLAEPAQGANEEPTPGQQSGVEPKVSPFQTALVKRIIEAQEQYGFAVLRGFLVVHERTFGAGGGTRFGLSCGP